MVLPFGQVVGDSCEGLVELVQALDNRKQSLVVADNEKVDMTQEDSPLVE